MTFWQLVKQESESVRRRIIITVACSGLANAAILAIINRAAETTANTGANLKLFLLFIIAMTAYIVCLRFSTREMNRVMIDMIHRIRLRIADKIQRSELPVLEKIDRSAILNAVTQEATIVADSGGQMTHGLHAAIVVFFATAYIGFLSLPAFFVTLACATLGIALVQQNRAFARELIGRTRSKEVEFLTYVRHAIEGFKETKLNMRRQLDLRDDLHRSSGEIVGLRIQTEELLSHNTILAQSSFYVMIAAVVFVLPRFIDTYSQVITEITMSILFIIGPLKLIVGLAPYFAKCNEATRAIWQLEEALDRGHAEQKAQREGAPQQPAPTMASIELDDVHFAYRAGEDEVFSLGPVSFTVEPGQIVFLVGGNGSGKSTLLKVLSGLYPPDTGSVRVGGVRVDATNADGYRELFAPVFADFHLFERLYGLLGTEPSRIDDLIREMQLDRKVRFVDDRFTTLDLSTGQRKRLALLIALLDDRPVLLFDELAADQDPEFRRYMYEVLLPRLKAEGRTIVAATHDDRYFHVADALIRLEYGRVDRVEHQTA